MSVELESAKRLTALKNKIDAKTETPSNTLSESVDNVIAGYGQGGSGDDKVIEFLTGSISGEFVIPEGMTEVRSGLLWDCKNITNVVLPSTLKTIGSSAFNGCANITNFDLPIGLEKIGERAFAGCAALTELIVPENVVKPTMYLIMDSGVKTLTIKCLQTENSAFRNSKNLETVFVENTTHLGIYTFGECKKLKTIYLPNTLVNVGGGCFYTDTSLEFITLEQGFKSPLDISVSTLYSVETLVAMFDAYADLTGQATKTLTIGPTNIAKLTEEQIAILTEKNVTLA